MHAMSERTTASAYLDNTGTVTLFPGMADVSLRLRIVRVDQGLNLVPRGALLVSGPFCNDVGLLVQTPCS
jgi:hypothetical protein